MTGMLALAAERCPAVTCLHGRAMTVECAECLALMARIHTRPIFAECSRCDGWVGSDRITVDQALADGWAVLDGQLVCADHLVPCTRCGDPCLLESDGCVKDGDWHCDEHAGDCGECGRYEASEREPYDY